MRLHEFLTDKEWQRLEQLIYETTWRALHAHHQRIATKPVPRYSPPVTKKGKSPARKTKRATYVAPPKPLPKPKQLPQVKAEPSTAYRPVKTATPLPPTTRMAAAKVQPRASQAAPKPSAPSAITNFGDLDQAARRLLPANKRGPNPIDLISP
jgi:hypothetical protein